MDIKVLLKTGDTGMAPMLFVDNVVLLGELKLS